MTNLYIREIVELSNIINYSLLINVCCNEERAGKKPCSYDSQQTENKS